MDRQEFTLLVNSYGADIRRWPEDLREEAKHHFAKFPAIVQEAGMLDRLLDNYGTTELAPAFIDNLVGMINASRLENVYLVFMRKARAPAALLAACAVLGFWTGTLTLPPDTASARLAQAQISDANDPHIEKIILGPTQVNEVLL